MSKKLIAAVPLLLLLTVLLIAGGGCEGSNNSTGPTISASDHITGTWRVRMERTIGAECFPADSNPFIFQMVVERSGGRYEVTFVDEDVTAVGDIIFDENDRNRFTLKVDKIKTTAPGCTLTEELYFTGEFITEDKIGGPFSNFKDLAYITGNCEPGAFVTCSLTGPFRMTRL